MPSLLSNEASVLELMSDSSRCVIAMNFLRFCSLGKPIRRYIEARVFSCFSFSEHLLSLCISQLGMRFGILRRPRSIFMCHGFHSCSSPNELLDEKWFCCDFLAYFVSSDGRICRVCSANDCDQGGESEKSCVPSSCQWMPSLLSNEASVLELMSDSSRCVIAMNFLRFCSLSKTSRRLIKGCVCFFSHSYEYLLRLVIPQSRMRFGFLRQLSRAIVFRCFRRNELRDERWFCSDFYSHFAFGK